MRVMYGYVCYPLQIGHEKKILNPIKISLRLFEIILKVGNAVGNTIFSHKKRLSFFKLNP